MSQTSSVPSPGAGVGPAPLFRAHELLQRAHDTLASGDLIKRPFQASLIACDERDVTPLQRDIAEWLRRCEAEPGRVLIEFVTEILTGPDATSDAERIAALVTALKAVDSAIENVLGLPIAPAAAKDRTEPQSDHTAIGYSAGQSDGQIPDSGDPRRESIATMLDAAPDLLDGPEDSREEQ
jgi:hypothetical protein